MATGEHRPDPNLRPVTRRRFVGGAAALGVALSSGGVLGACGGGETAGGGKPRRGGSLRVGLAGGSPADTLDAHAPLSSAAVARTFNLNEGLAAQDPDLKIVLVLAEELSPNATGDVWTVRLKSGSEFHNGKTITADDVIFTIRRIADPKNPQINAPRFAAVDLNRLRKRDDRTVEIAMKRPYAVLDESFASIGSQIVPANYNPRMHVGAGPFKLQSFKPGERSVFQRFENYVGDVALVNELEMVDLPDDSARVNALTGGEVEAIDAVPYAQVPVLEKQKSVVVEDVESGAWRPFVMNMSKPPFDDVRVRQAFRLIADRKELVAQAYAGHGAVAPDLSQRYDSCGLVEEVEREQDIEQARALLTGAGQENLSVELTTSSISGGIVEASQVFAEQAKAAGVTVKLRKVDPGTYFARYGQWTFGVDYWPENPFWSQVEVGNLPNAPLNPQHWDDDKYTSLYEQGSGELDEGKRCEIAKEMQRIVFERGALLVWGFANAVDAHASSVAGYVRDRSGWSSNRWRYNLVGFVA